MKDIIKNIIADFHERGIPSFKRRNISIPLDSGKIVAVIGPRRAGKTYLLYQTISRIKDLRNVVYINFEDERLEFKHDNLNLIIESYLELYPDKKESEIYFFFDEIQEVERWEKFVRRAYDSINKNIFLSGSSSKLLSKEIATSLRGRTISYEVYPLSFKEYLEFNGVTENINSTKGKARAYSLFDEYLFKGGFPEIVGKEEILSSKIIQNYFEVMLYRDIVERYNISNHSYLKFFMKKLLSNPSREFSLNKIFNEIKSRGLKASKDSLYSYLDYCEDAYIILPISNFSESISKQTSRKAYSIDTGLSLQLSYSLSKDKGRLFENVVFLELRRQGKKVFFNKGKNECDFLIKEKENITELLQACYELNEENYEREAAGLKEAMKRFNILKGSIITLDKGAGITKRDEDIEIISFFDWIL